MTDSTRERKLEDALRECRNEFSQAFHKVMWPYLSEESKDHVAGVLSLADAALAASVAEPHQHTSACYSKVPETEGRGEYLSCGKVAVAEPDGRILDMCIDLCEKQRQKVLANAADPSWTEHFAELQEEIRKLARAVAEKAPAPRLRDLREQLGILLASEDITDEDLRQASEGLLPNIYDALGAAEKAAPDAPPPKEQNDNR